MITNSITNTIVPDVFVQEVEPPASINGAAIGTIGIVVQAIRGKVGEPTLVSSLSDYVRKFGDYNVTLKDDFMFVYNLFKQGVSRAKVVRATDGTHATATCTASGSVFTLDTPGSWGNSMTLVSTDSSVTGYVDLKFTYGSETYVYKQVTFTNSSDDRYITTVLRNAPEKVIDITTVGASNPVGTFSFTGGSDGTLKGLSLTDTSYAGTNGATGRTGLTALEPDSEVEIVALPRTSTTANNAVKDHVSLTGISPRMGVIAPASGSQVSDVVTLMASFNTDRLIVTYPFLQVTNLYNGKNEYHTPVPFYAGLLSKLNYHESPSRQQVLGVIGTERQLSPAEVETLTGSRVSPITLLPGFGFVVRNGLNASANPSKSQTTRRRAVNYFAKTFETGAQQFVSKPHTPQLRNDIKTAFGALLEGEKQLNRIGTVTGTKPYSVKCDGDNNFVETVRQGKVFVDVAISLWANADFIIVRLDASEGKVISAE